MVFIDDVEKVTKESEIYKYITKISENLDTIIKVQIEKKKILTQMLDEIADIKVEEINYENTENLLVIIEEIKSLLDRINDNIDGTKKLLSEINKILKRINNIISNNQKDELLNKDINYFYILYLEKQNMIEETNLNYERLLFKTYQNIFLSLSKKTKKEDLIVEKDIMENNENIEESVEKNIQIQQESKDIDSENIKRDDAKKEESEVKAIENNAIITELEDNNILKISELQNKIFLPYKINKLENILKENQDKYKNMEDLINKEYIVSLDRYKNPAFSRFKEAYHLMREKEKSSFSEALDLALEVTFKSNLNPAVITACNNIEELDMYMECLELNDLDKFNTFKIEYESLPVKK